MSVSSQQVFQFIQTNWLALLSLVVALLGGVRGLIDLRNWQRSYARMAAYMEHLKLIDVNKTDIGIFAHAIKRDTPAIGFFGVRHFGC